MRCKPGQLAILTRDIAVPTCMRNCIGAVVCTIQIEFLSLSAIGPVWRVAPAVQCPKCRVRMTFIPDSCLTPIEPPGPEENIYSVTPISTDVRAPSRTHEDS